MKKISEKYKRQLDRAYARESAYKKKEKESAEVLNYHGGYSFGYYSGKIDALENAIDDIVALEEEVERLKENQNDTI
jgi:hypothetical protein